MGKLKKMMKLQEKLQRKVNPKRYPAIQKPKTNPFQMLPAEMIDLILSKLPLEAKKSARLVSKSWNSILERSTHFSLPLTNATLSEFRSRSYSIKELEVVLNELEAPHRFTPNMKRSFITTKILSFKASRYLNGVGTNDMDGTGIMSLIKACKNMHALKIDFRFLEKYFLTSYLRLNNIRLESLHTLQLKFAYGGCNDVSVTLFDLCTPCLRNLEVERFSVNADDGTFRDENLYFRLQQFMARNKGSLKTLKLVNSLTNISTISGHEPLPPNLLNELAQLKLESIEIEDSVISTPNIVDDWTAANPLLGNQTMLKVLKIDSGSDALFRKSYGILAACRNTLTKLDLDIRSSEMEFDLIVLLDLEVLTHFSLTSHEDLLGPFFPSTLKHLVWNAPLGLHWYLSESRAYLPNLVTMTVGETHLPILNIRTLVAVLFGSGKQRTKLEQLALRRKPALLVNGRKTWSKGNRWKKRVQAAHNLPAAYKVEHQDDYIRIQLSN